MVSYLNFYLLLIFEVVYICYSIYSLELLMQNISPDLNILMQYGKFLIYDHQF